MTERQIDMHDNSDHKRQKFLSRTIVSVGTEATGKGYVEIHIFTISDSYHGQTLNTWHSKAT